MNLLFHDRSTVATAPGAATLTIERSGNFTFSAGAVARLKLRMGSELVLAQDVDSPRTWFLLLCDERLPAHVKPFAVRTAGAKNGGRLVFSSAHRATAYFQAYSEVISSKQRLTIGDMAASYDAAGLLWPLLPEQPVVRNEVLQQPDPVKAAAQVAENKRLHPAPIAPDPKTVKLRGWSEQDVETLRRLYPTTMAKDIALVLRRGLSAVFVKASDLGLKKGQTKGSRANARDLTTKPMPATASKKPSNHLPEVDDINPALESKLLKLVDRLGSMKLFKMDEHEARQALQLLTSHVDKLEWVLGAERLRERLAGCYSLPANGLTKEVPRG